MDIYELLKYANESGVSDLFAAANKIPAFRLNGPVLQSEGDLVRRNLMLSELRSSPKRKRNATSSKAAPKRHSTLKPAKGSA